MEKKEKIGLCQLVLHDTKFNETSHLFTARVSGSSVSYDLKEIGFYVLIGVLGVVLFVISIKVIQRKYSTMKRKLLKEATRSDQPYSSPRLTVMMSERRPLAGSTGGKSDDSPTFLINEGKMKPDSVREDLPPIASRRITKEDMGGIPENQDAEEA